MRGCSSRRFTGHSALHTVQHHSSTIWSPFNVCCSLTVLGAPHRRHSGGTRREISVSGKDVARESLARPVRTFGGCSRRRQRVNRAHLPFVTATATEARPRGRAPFDDIFNANEAEPLTAWAGTFVRHLDSKYSGRERTHNQKLGMKAGTN